MRHEQRAQHRIVDAIAGKRNPAAIHDPLVMWGTNALGAMGLDNPSPAPFLGDSDRAVVSQLARQPDKGFVAGFDSRTTASDRDAVTAAERDKQAQQADPRAVK